jgi:hypothetical protein
MLFQVEVVQSCLFGWLVAGIAAGLRKLRKLFWLGSGAKKVVPRGSSGSVDSSRIARSHSKDSLFVRQRRSSQVSGKLIDLNARRRLSSSNRVAESKSRTPNLYMETKTPERKSIMSSHVIRESSQSSEALFQDLKDYQSRLRTTGGVNEGLPLYREGRAGVADGGGYKLGEGEVRPTTWRNSLLRRSYIDAMEGATIETDPRFMAGSQTMADIRGWYIRHDQLDSDLSRDLRARRASRPQYAVPDPPQPLPPPDLQFSTDLDNGVQIAPQRRLSNIPEVTSGSFSTSVMNMGSSKGPVSSTSTPSSHSKSDTLKFIPEGEVEEVSTRSTSQQHLRGGMTQKINIES